MGVCSRHNRGFQQPVVSVYRRHCIGHECYKLQIVLGSLAGRVEQHTFVCAQAPIVVLARAVDACEWLLVEKHTEIMASCHLCDERHQQ